MLKIKNSTQKHSKLKLFSSLMNLLRWILTLLLSKSSLLHSIFSIKDRSYNQLKDFICLEKQ